MADPAQHKREKAPGLADQWRHGDVICFCVSASWRLHPLLGPYLQAYTASQLRSLQRAPGRLDHRPVHIVRGSSGRHLGFGRRQAGCGVWSGWVRVCLVRVCLDWDLEQISWSVALYRRPSMGLSASALDGNARHMVMEVAWHEEKWDRGVDQGTAAVRTRGARSTGIVAQPMVGRGRRSVPR